MAYNAIMHTLWAYYIHCVGVSLLCLQEWDCGDPQRTGKQMWDTYFFMPAKKREKQIGQVFTPDFIVNRMLGSVGYTVKTDILNKHIIDNSCGNVDFLAQVV